VLEAVAQGAAAGAANLTGQQLLDPVAVLQVILADGRLEQLLGLADARDYRFKRRRYGPTELVPVDLQALVLAWVRGATLGELVEDHLTGIDVGDDDGYRFEQLSTFLTRICEHHLPFTLGTVLEWINSDRIDELCPSLPAHVHYGVADAKAIELLTHGVRSRRLAVAVGQRAAADGVTIAELRKWLSDLGAPAWRTAFAAGPTEVGDLLQFVHDPAAAIGASLLDGNIVTMPVDSAGVAWGSAGELPIVASIGEERPRPLVIVNSHGEVVGRIRAAEHRHLAVLTDSGFQLLASSVADEDAEVTEIQVRADLD
jgi:hypothetical protein